MMTVTVFIRLH